MKKYIDTGKKDTRSGFGAGLLEAGRADERVVALTAGIERFSKITMPILFILIVVIMGYASSRT